MFWVVGFLIAVALFLRLRSYTRSEFLLHQWAKGNGYPLLGRRHRTFFTGPFFWTPAKKQTVYYVAIADRAGNLRRGLVRWPKGWSPIGLENVEVRWDD